DVPLVQPGRLPGRRRRAPSRISRATAADAGGLAPRRRLGRQANHHGQTRQGRTRAPRRLVPLELAQRTSGTSPIQAVADLRKRVFIRSCGLWACWLFTRSLPDLCSLGAAARSRLRLELRGCLVMLLEAWLRRATRWP